MSDKKPTNKPVINLDEDPHNANWLRILEQQRQAQQGPTADDQAQDQFAQAMADAANAPKPAKPKRRHDPLDDL